MSQKPQTQQPEEIIFHTVTAYQEANIRPTPSISGDPIGQVKAGESYSALCWTRGQTVTDNGITHNIWIRLLALGYVSAIYFKGNERANLPSDAEC